jgi:hypothetical protein
MPRIQLLFLAVLLGGGGLLSCASSRNTTTQSQTIVGQVFVIGNEPFTKLALKVEGGQTYVLVGTKEIESMLLQHQGQIVQILTTGVEETSEGKAWRVIQAEVLSDKSNK